MEVGIGIAIIILFILIKLTLKWMCFLLAIMFRAIGFILSAFLSFLNVLRDVVFHGPVSFAVTAVIVACLRFFVKRKRRLLGNCF